MQPELFNNQTSVEVSAWLSTCNLLRFTTKLCWLLLMLSLLPPLFHFLPTNVENFTPHWTSNHIWWSYFFHHLIFHTIHILVPVPSWVENVSLLFLLLLLSLWFQLVSSDLLSVFTPGLLKLSYLWERGGAVLSDFSTSTYSSLHPLVRQDRVPLHSSGVRTVAYCQRCISKAGSSLVSTSHTEIWPRPFQKPTRSFFYPHSFSLFCLSISNEMGPLWGFTQEPAKGYVYMTIMY